MSVIAIAGPLPTDELDLRQGARPYESRGAAMMALLADADSRGWLCRPLQAVVGVGDNFDPDAGFSMAGGAAELERLVPAFVFEAWPEVHIFGYESTVRSIVRASRSAPVSDKLFWAGADSHPLRIKAAGWAVGRSDADFRLIEWDKSNPSLLQHVKRVSLPAHTEFAALVDLPGRGYSGRLPFLLASGRPVYELA